MKYRVWLDDVREMPPGYSLHAKTAQEAIDLLERGEVEHISLDHDLADEHYTMPNAPSREMTGYDVALAMVRLGYTGTWLCHSMNPVGRARIEATLRAKDAL